jgi:hypothetical protein
MKGVLLVEGSGELDDMSGQAPLASFQDPAFGFGESGEIDVSELIQRAFGLGEARLELARGRAQGRDGTLAGLGGGAAGIAREGLAGGGVWGGAPGGEKRFGLAGAQAMTHDGLGHALLLARREGGQSVGDSGGEPTSVEVSSQVGGEPTTEGQPTLYPAATMPQQLGELGEREMIVVGQGADHAGFVHGAPGPPGRVGLEHSGLAHHPGGVFDHHGHVAVALAAPALQALEAIEDFVGAVGGGGHAQGQRGQGGRGIGARAPEGSERGEQSIDRDGEDRAHGCGSWGRGRSW